MMREAGADRARIARATAYIQSMNNDLAIQAICEREGTVHIIFPFGMTNGLDTGSVLQVVRQSTSEVLGTVEVVESLANLAYARPTDRHSPEFWDHLEARMKRDFAPPDDVVGRTFQMTPLPMSDLLNLLRGG